MKHNINNSKRNVKIILVTSFIFALLYIAFENPLMEFGKNNANPMLERFLPVALIQFGMAGLGISIVQIRNKESFNSYGLVKRNLLYAIFGSLLCSIPTILFLFFTHNIHGFLPFQGMFLTKSIVTQPFPFNFIGYAIISLIWGFFEGLNYVVLSQKINEASNSYHKHFNKGAFICALLSILIHGMIGIDLLIIIEACTTFLLIYGSLVIKEKTGNAWGCILIFFFIWNAF